MYATSGYYTTASHPPPSYNMYTASPKAGIYTTTHPRETPRSHTRRASEGPTAAGYGYGAYYATATPGRGPPPPPQYSSPQPYGGYATMPEHGYSTKYASPTPNRGGHYVATDYVSPEQPHGYHQTSHKKHYSTSTPRGFPANSHGPKAQQQYSSRQDSGAARYHTTTPGAKHASSAAFESARPHRPRSSSYRQYDGARHSSAAKTQSARRRQQRSKDDEDSESSSESESESSEDDDSVASDYDAYGYNYSPEGSPPPPYNAASADAYHSAYWNGTYYAYTTGAQQQQSSQDRAYASAKYNDTPPGYKSSTRPRANTFTSSSDRRPGHVFNSTPSKSQKQSSQKQRPSTSSKSTPKHQSYQQQEPSPKATAADAARAGIPAGFSYKNWDPTEMPIYLLGSVFDANSLGKWIYDWTVFHHGPATPMADLAGDLWLLLIKVSGKMKRAQDIKTRVRDRDDADMLEDFMDSGDRLWARLAKILKACEDYMWREAKKDQSSSGAEKRKNVEMGARSGCEFVDSIFGRNRKLLDTEKLMAGMRLWSMRFDANCDDILRYPGGAQR